MKRILRLTGGLLGMLALAGLVVALVVTFQGLRGEPQAESPLFQSPIQTPTPSRPQVTPSRAPTLPAETPPAVVLVTSTPTLTPLPPRPPTRTPPPILDNERPKGAPVPEPTWERPFIPISKPEDVISIVISDPGFQSTMDAFFFGPQTKEIMPGKPVYVRALSGKYEGYYVLPFYYQNELVGLAAVGLQQGKGRLVSWSKAEVPRFPPLNAHEARIAVEELGYQVVNDPELVYDTWKSMTSFHYGGNPTAPFWKVKVKKRKDLYVLYDFSTHRPIIYDVKADRLLK